MAKAKVDYESMLAQELDFAGYKYTREFQFHPSRRWRCDFFIEEHNLIVEIEGIQYRGAGRHQTGAGYQEDCDKYNQLTLLGYRLLRFTPAMVTGRAKRKNKDRTPMAKAIDIIDILCLGTNYVLADRTKQGYAICR